MKCLKILFIKCMIGSCNLLCQLSANLQLWTRVKNTPSRTACLRKNSTTVQAVEESLVPVYLTNSKAKEHHLIGARLPSSIHMDYSMFPIYHPSTIQIPIDSRLLPAVPQKVFIHGTPNPSFFKIVYRGDVGITLKEPLTYSKIHTAKFDATVRTSRLEGLVEDDNGRVMGPPPSYIDCVLPYSALMDAIPGCLNFGKNGLTKSLSHWSTFILKVLSGEMQKLPTF